jgi:hypothetical protein
MARLRMCTPRNPERRETVLDVGIEPFEEDEGGDDGCGAEADVVDWIHPTRTEVRQSACRQKVHRKEIE